MEGPGGTLIVFDTDGFPSAGILQEGKRLLVRARTQLSGWLRRRTRRDWVAAALILGLFLPLLRPAEAGDAQSVKPTTTASDAEFDGECVMGLALGKDIKTDCSVSTVYGGRTYCFGNETAKQLFLKKPDEFLLQAHVYYSSKQPAQSDSNIDPKAGE
jgi:YHS domain-containing protein